MNTKELRCEMLRNDFTVESFARAIGIGKKALYAKLSGKSSFKQSEIQKISEVLNLSSAQIVSIFFASVVS